MKNPLIAVLFLLLICPKIKAQNSFFETDSLFHLALNFVTQNQIKTTLEEKQYAGEWPVYMDLKSSYIFLGKSQKVVDSNCFTTSAIHNFLAEIYLRDSSDKELLPVLQKSHEQILIYRIGTAYNFWRLLPAKKNHKFLGNKNFRPLVHRPTNFQLKNKLIAKMANVAEDADDTNLASLANYYHNQIFNDSVKVTSDEVFEKWSDGKRQNRNWYNALFHIKKNSGAYLTWLSQEKKLGIWTPIHSLTSIITIFLPTSSAYPTAYEPWIPFGANDVDPIVNANILCYLATSQQYKDSKISQAACKMITEIIKKERWQTAGIYYPNIYHLHFSIGRAYAAGVNNLKEAAQLCINHLLKTQQSDGSFVSPYFVNNGDSIQSTAYALHAMLDFKKQNLMVPEKNIELAKDFIISKAIKNKDEVHWPGGIFFTSGTALRYVLQWHSDAYTTALIASILQKYRLLKPEENEVSNYPDKFRE